MDYYERTEAIVSAGMQLLSENLGVLEMEIFLVAVKSPGFDYTKWRENLWENLTLPQLMEKAHDYAVEFDKKYPDFNKGKQIL
jgi:hypothetical protein